VPILGRGAHGDDHLTLLGEFDRVADQVHQDLAQPPWDHRARRAAPRRDFGEQLEIVFHGRAQARRLAVACTTFETSKGIDSSSSARLDFGVVEDVVEDHEQRFGRRPHQLERTGAARWSARCRGSAPRSRAPRSSASGSRGSCSRGNAERARATRSARSRAPHHPFGELGGFSLTASARSRGGDPPV